jgi:hypothetical protein
VGGVAPEVAPQGGGLQAAKGGKSCRTNRRTLQG